jgi:hypothetical protein
MEDIQRFIETNKTGKEQLKIQRFEIFDEAAFLKSKEPDTLSSKVNTSVSSDTPNPFLGLTPTKNS